MASVSKAIPTSATSAIKTTGRFGIQSTICGPPILRHDEMHTELEAAQDEPLSRLP
jgi:hypothetical protein